MSRSMENLAYYAIDLLSSVSICILSDFYRWAILFMNEEVGIVMIGIVTIFP